MENYLDIKKQRDLLLEELKIISDLNFNLNMQVDLDSTIRVILDSIENTFDFDVCNIAIIDENGLMTIKSVFEKNMPPLKKSELTILKNFFSEKRDYKNDPMWMCVVAREDIEMYYPEINPDDFLDWEADFLRFIKISSLYYLPIKLSKKTYGTLGFANYNGKTLNLSEFEKDILRRRTILIANFIENSIFYNKLKKRNEQIENLNLISTEIGRKFDLKHVFNNIVEYLFQTYGFEGCSLDILNKEKNHYKVELTHFPAFLKDETEGFEGRCYPLDERGGRIASTILTGETTFFTDIIPEKIENKVNRETVEYLKIKSALNIPIKIGDNIIGAFTLSSHSKPIYLTEEDIDSIKMFVNQIAIILRDSKVYDDLSKLKEELEVKDKIISTDLYLAKKLVDKIIPFHFEDFEKIKIDYYYKPLMDVGGDIFDIVKLKENYYRFFIADATGHGVSAALITMLIKSEYDKIKKYSFLPNIILKVFNDEYISNYENLNMFFTCMVIDIDLENNKIVYSSAGHPSQFLISNEDVILLKSTGKMIGVSKNIDFELRNSDYYVNDNLFLFTDGIFEEFTEKGEEFGISRLRNVIIENFSNNNNKMINKVISKVEQWKNGTPSNDDITLFLIKRIE